MKMSTPTNTEFAAMNVNAGDLAFRDFDLGGMPSEKLARLNLTFKWIKLPSGGIIFKILGDDLVKPDTVKDFETVILYSHAMNAYYNEEY